MKISSNRAPSPLRRQAADTFMRAKKLPSGPHRDDLLQLAFQLRRLHKLGLKANVQILEERTQ
jgi:hypothetical protein